MTTRLYLGRLPQDVRRSDIEDLFKGYGVSSTRLRHSYHRLDVHTDHPFLLDSIASA